jgi:hypothetical protein
MARRAKTVFFSTLAVATALLSVGYFQTRSTWRTATDAEIRRIVDPSLLAEQKPDPAAQERYERAIKVLGKLKMPVGYVSARARAMPDFLRNERGAIEELEKILAAGPIARPSAGLNVDVILPSSRLTPGVKIFAEAAQIEANAGRSESAARLFRLCLGLAYAFTGHCEDFSDTLFRDHHAKIVFKVLHPSLEKFDDRQLEQIALAIPSQEVADEDFPRVIRREFQDKIFPLLPDPRLYAGRMIRERTALTADVSGSYDALETARFLNDAYLATMANVVRPRHHQYDAYAKRAGFLRITLPTDQTPGARGPWIPVRRLQYRIQMARTPNSFARSALFPIVEIHGHHIASSFWGRTNREAIRTLIALRRYRLRFGASAPLLQTLVRQGLLPAVPIDYWGKAELRYDPHRRRLWSAGEDGLDNGGVDPRFTSPRAADYIWRTP